MQSQMIGMQSSLDRILSAIQQNQAAMQHATGYSGGPRDGPVLPPPIPPLRNGPDNYNPGEGSSRPKFPPLPGFAPPVSPIVRLCILRANNGHPRSLTSTPHMVSFPARHPPPMTSRRIRFQSPP